MSISASSSGRPARCSPQSGAEWCSGELSAGGCAASGALEASPRGDEHGEPPGVGMSTRSHAARSTDWSGSSCPVPAEQSTV